MEQVAPRLYIGGLDAAGDPEMLRRHGITAAVKLTHSEPDTPYPDDVTVAAHPLVDGPQSDFEDFREAVDRLWRLLDAGETVLVHCSVGSSRSGAVAAAALARVTESEIDGALAHIQTEKPDVEPHPALLEHARRAAD